MGLPAFKIEFEEVAAAMPPLPRLVLSQPTGEDPLVGMHRRVEIFSTRLDLWRSEAKLWVPGLRALFEHADEAGEVAAVEMMLQEKLPRLLADFDALLDELSNGLAELRSLFSLMRSRLEPDALPLLTTVEAAVDEAFAKLRRIVGEALDEIKTIEWDFDPSARGGNRPFNNPDDLIAFLNS